MCLHYLFIFQVKKKIPFLIRASCSFGAIFKLLGKKSRKIFPKNKEYFLI